MPSNSPFPTFEDHSRPSYESGGSHKKVAKHFIIQWKSGKRVDPRLLGMLQSFRELYEERQEFFKKIFPKSHDEFADVFKKIGVVVPTKKDHVKVQTIQRSLSLGSPRSPTQAEESEFRLNRFKVRTPAVAVVRPDGQGGASSQDGTISNGSK